MRHFEEYFKKIDHLFNCSPHYENISKAIELFDKLMKKETFVEEYIKPKFHWNNGELFLSEIKFPRISTLILCHSEYFPDFYKNRTTLTLEWWNPEDLIKLSKTIPNLQRLYLQPHRNYDASAIPKEVLYFSNLRFIKASYVSKIEPFLAEIPHLQELDVRESNITYIPHVLLEKESLTSILIGYTELNQSYRTRYITQQIFEHPKIRWKNPQDKYILSSCLDSNAYYPINKEKKTQQTLYKRHRELQNILNRN